MDPNTFWCNSWGMVEMFMLTFFLEHIWIYGNVDQNMKRNHSWGLWRWCGTELWPPSGGVDSFARYVAHGWASACERLPGHLVVWHLMTTVNPDLYETIFKIYVVHHMFKIHMTADDSWLMFWIISATCQGAYLLATLMHNWHRPLYTRRGGKRIIKVPQQFLIN